MSLKPAVRLLSALVILQIAPAWASDACSTRAILTAADVTVSDGSTFKTESFFHASDAAAIRHIDGDERISVVEGPLSWTETGDSSSLGSELHKNFVLGHQFHAFLLHFDEVVSNVRSTEQILFRGEIHQGDSGDYPYGGVAHLVHGDDKDRPRGLLFEFPDTAPISVAFLDWRELDGDILPFHAQIDDGERTFDYHYTSVDIAPKSPLWFFEAITAPDIDRLQIYRLHRKLLAAHCLGDADMMSRLSAPQVIMASRGEIQNMTNTGIRDVFAGVFERLDYVQYHDLVSPVIEASPGGDIGWIWVNVRAVGREKSNGEPFDDQWAWVMTVRKIGGDWLHSGNASSAAE